MSPKSAKYMTLIRLSYNAKYITNLIRTSKGLRNFALDSHDCVVMMSTVCNKHYLYLLKSKRFADTAGIPTKRYANPKRLHNSCDLVFLFSPVVNYTPPLGGGLRMQAHIH